MINKKVLGAKCINCGYEIDIKEVNYLCPKCNGNLDIIYDYKNISKILDKKYFENNKDYSIWRYLPLLPVESNGNIPLNIGWTPLYHKKYKDIELYIKDDGRNPSASLKDRASAVALVNFLERKLDKITGASTGNAGSSMACLCASINISPIIFVPKNAPKAKIAQLLVFGAKVVTVNGSYDDAFDLCLKVSNEFGWYNRNTGYNPFTREGKKTCAFEICEQLNWQVPDWVIVSVGDGNIISGMWKGWKDLKNTRLIEKTPKIIGVQSKLSNAIVKAFKKYKETGKINIEPVKATTIADSISVDLPRDGGAALKSIIESNGLAIEVSDEEILDCISKTAREWGVFGEPAGVTSIAGFEKLYKENIFKPNEKVVCVITGNGLKDIESAIKSVGEPILINPSLDEVKRVI